MDEAGKVLIVGSFAPSLISFRGALIAAMAKAGHSVVAAAPAIDPATAAGLRKLGAEPPKNLLSNSSLDPFAFVRSLGAMRRLVREARPDVMISYAIKPVILGALAGRAERVGRIVSVITGVGYAFTAGR